MTRCYRPQAIAIVPDETLIILGVPHLSVERCASHQKNVVCFSNEYRIIVTKLLELFNMDVHQETRGLWRALKGNQQTFYEDVELYYDNATLERLRKDDSSDWCEIDK